MIRGEICMTDSGQILKNIRDNIAKVIVGRERTVDLVLVCRAAGGHALVEDVPGTGKASMARSLAASASLAFSRIQFTPDLLPSDVTGLNYFDQGKSAFVFRRGPVFTNILLADEINRATPRTQSALLECMAEQQVTVDGETRQLTDPFLVIATQNPVETLGTYPLPEAQMDRFLMQISMGDMSVDEEVRMIDRFITREPLTELQPAASGEDIIRVRSACRAVRVHRDLRRYMAELVHRTRGGSGAAAGEGVSPRGTLALLRASQGYALLQGRDYVVPEDIREVTLPVLAHRCLSRSIASASEKEARIRTAIASTEVPTEDWSR